MAGREVRRKLTVILRSQYGGMGKSKLHEFKALEKERLFEAYCG